MNPPSIATPARFGLLVEALSERIGAPLDPGEGTVVLADDVGSVRLVLEVSADNDRVHAVVPFLEFPDEDTMGELALRVLQLNADREALGSATLAADVNGGRFCAIQSLDLALEPVPFIEAVEALVGLAERARTFVSPPELAFDAERAITSFLRA